MMKNTSLLTNFKTLVNTISTSNRLRPRKNTVDNLTGAIATLDCSCMIYFYRYCRQCSLHFWGERRRMGYVIELQLWQTSRHLIRVWLCPRVSTMGGGGVSTWGGDCGEKLESGQSCFFSFNNFLGLGSRRPMGERTAGIWTVEWVGSAG